MSTLVPIQHALTYLGSPANDAVSVQEELDAAQATLEGLLGGRQLTQATRTFVLRGTGTEELMIPEWPVVSIASITASRRGLEEATSWGQLIGLGAPALEDVVIEGRGRLVRADDGVWQTGGTYTIVATVGYTAETLPADLRQAILRIVEHGRTTGDSLGLSKERLGRSEISYSQTALPEQPWLRSVLAAHRRTAVSV